MASVGSGVNGFKGGEWVLISKQQAGTWKSAQNVDVGDVIRVPEGASEVGAATLTVSAHLANLYLTDGSVRSTPPRPMECYRTLWT